MPKSLWFLLCAALMAAHPAEARKRQAEEAARCMALAALGHSAPASALLLSGFDRDNDALITRAELQTGTAQAFAAADADGDGVLGLAELGVWAVRWLGSADARPGRFDFDRDGDDRITAAEFEAELSRQFATFDADKDGIVTRAELLTVRPDVGCGPRGAPNAATPPPRAR